MLLIEIAIFLLLQIVIFFVFYRLVLRELPAQINELLFTKHLENDFTEIPRETALLVRNKLLQLEEERFDAFIRYKAVKGKRGLSVTEDNERRALKKSVGQLDKLIKSCRTEINNMYTPDVLTHLRKFEEWKLVSVINRYLDSRNVK